MDNFKKLGFIVLGLMAIGFILQNTVAKPNENFGAPPSPSPVETVASFDGDSFLGWAKPSDVNLAAWAEDVKKESLNVKHDYQLDQLISMHQKKLDEKIAPILEKYLKYPDLLKSEAEEQLKNSEQPYTQADIDRIADEKLKQARWDVAKLRQSVKRAQMEKQIRSSRFIDRTPEILGTTYYIDCVNGNNASAGTATNTAWRTIDQFTENARVPGDKAIVRGGNYGLKTATTENCGDGSPLTFTSDGFFDNPIVIERDYDNIWRENVSSTQTYTATYGSKTLTASAQITDGRLLATGPNGLASSTIYISGDDPREFMYEVATAANTTITLYLPYKGAQAGSGKTIGINPSNPLRGSTSTSFVTIASDDFWKIQGITVTGTISAGVIQANAATYWELKDVSCLGGVAAGAVSSCFGETGSRWDVVIFNKVRTLWETNGINANGAGMQYVTVKNSLFEGTGTANGKGISIQQPSIFYIENTEFKNHTQNDISSNGVVLNRLSTVNARGNITSTTSTLGNAIGWINIEDFGGVVGFNKNMQPAGYSSAFAKDTTVISSVTSTIRSGGGDTSILTTPTTSLSTVWDLSKIKLFEYPIYSTAAARQVDVYMSVTATANFTADPGANELWIEAEYWGTTGNNAVKKITKSTGVLDFNGTTDWQNLTINFTPAQAGIVYLRGYYAKTQESGKSNQFLVDVKPVLQ